jgi:hypothetical protein
MAVEVIQRGHLPENDQFEATCSRCRSQLRFLRSDAKLTHDQRDGDFVTISYPVCSNSVHASASKGTPPPPKK